MALFKKKIITQYYDKENKKPVIKASICNGEQVAGFKDIHCVEERPFQVSKLYDFVGPSGYAGTLRLRGCLLYTSRCV